MNEAHELAGAAQPEQGEDSSHGADWAKTMAELGAERDAHITEQDELATRGLDAQAKRAGNVAEVYYQA